VTAEPIIELRELSISARDRLLVDGVSFDVYPGDAIAIVGESGSGKSLTTRAITGLLARGLEVSGSLKIDGQEFIGASSRMWREIRGRRVALMPQDPFTMLSPLRTVGAQIRDGARRGLTDAEIEERLREVGIDDAAVMRKYPFQLSGGLRQRAGLAAALAGDPDVLLADEPSTALDVTTQAKVLRLLGRLRAERGLALVIITHDLGVAFSVSDRTLILYGGSLLEFGPSSTLARASRHPYTRRLIECEPTIDHRMEDLSGIPGSVPRADDVVHQCAFADRCDLTVDACLSRRPPLISVGTDHASACLRHEDVLASEQSPGRSGTASDRVPDNLQRPVLIVDSVTRRFEARRGTAGVVALDSVSLVLHAGESLGVVGESGSGKTTLSRLIAGLDVPNSGTISFPEVTASSGGPRPVQIVFQDPSATLNPARKIGPMLADALRAAGLASDKDAIADLLALVSLPEEYAERKPAALSGGERQRIAIARALAPRPRVLLCDEPVSALDVSVQAQILDLIRTVQQQQGVALIFITHDLAVVRQVSDRVMVLRHGQLIEEGTTASVLDHPHAEYTRELIASVPRV
jgi:peptide/nickel transport system ATP-binding protein